MNIRLGGRRKSCSVHSLVMLAFVGPRPPGAHINHINSDPADNSVENLEYCTLRENIDHCTRAYWMSRRSHLASLVRHYRHYRKFGWLDRWLKTTTGRAALYLWGDRVRGDGPLGRPIRRTDVSAKIGRL